MGIRVLLMVRSDVLLVYPGKDRGIRSGTVLFLKPIFAMVFDRCSQSAHIWLFVYKQYLIIFNEQCGTKMRFPERGGDSHMVQNENNTHKMMARKF